MPFDKVEGSRVYYFCDSCGARFRFGQGRYDGVHLAELGITVCRGCGPDSPWQRAEAVERLKHLKRAT
jgi:hypothetical protein